MHYILYMFIITYNAYNIHYMLYMLHISGSITPFVLLLWHKER